MRGRGNCRAETRVEDDASGPLGMNEVVMKEL